METLTLKIPIPFDEIRKMACRIHGEIWTDKQIFEYFKSRKTLEIYSDEIKNMDDDAFEVFIALALAIPEVRNRPTKPKSKFEQRLETMRNKNAKK